MDKKFVVSVLHAPKCFSLYSSGRRDLSWVVSRIVDYSRVLMVACEGVDADIAEMAKLVFKERFTPMCQATPEDYAKEILEVASQVSQSIVDSMSDIEVREREQKISELAQQKAAEALAEAERLAREEFDRKSRVEAEALAAARAEAEKIVMSEESPVANDSPVVGDDSVVDNATGDDEGDEIEPVESVSDVDKEKEFYGYKVSDLQVHGLAKSAYKKAGIETVQDVLDFTSTGKSLEEVNGIGDDFAEDTLKAIEELRVKILG